MKAVSPGYSPDQIVMRDITVHLAAGIAEMEDALDPAITAIHTCFARTDWGNHFRAVGQGGGES